MAASPPRVELWLVDVVHAGPALAAMEHAIPRLSEDERRRAAELSRSGRDWRLLRVALRLLLERIVGPRLRGVPLRTTARGKPELPWDSGIHFSLSHSGRHGLIAISWSEVGVDLEQDRRVQFPPERQKAMQGAARALVSASSDPAPGPLGSLQAWVRLEAWGKARGSGIGALLHDLGIRGPAWRASGGTADFGDRAAGLLEREGFSLHDLPLSPPLHGAAATRAGSTLLPVRHLPADLTSLQALVETDEGSTQPMG